MTYQDSRIVPVRFEGGSLDGDLNELDYAEHELQEMLTPSPPGLTPVPVAARRSIR